MELQDGNRKGAKYQLSRALQECPKDGQLLGLLIELENKSNRKRLSVQALQKTDNDPHVIMSVAKIFWRERKHNKARKWFDRAVNLDRDLGDAWVYYYAFEVDVKE